MLKNDITSDFHRKMLRYSLIFSCFSAFWISTILLSTWRNYNPALVLLNNWFQDPSGNFTVCEQEHLPVQ